MSGGVGTLTGLRCIVYPLLRIVCVRAPLLGRRGVSVRSRKSGMCKSRSETMYVSEGLLEPASRMFRVKTDSRSEGNAPYVWGLSAGSALASGPASRGEGGGLGRSLEWRISWDDSSWMIVWMCSRSGE